MSTPTPETTTPAPAPKLADRLITIAGLLLFIAGLVVARVLRDSDAELAADLGDLLKSCGTVVAAIGGALPIPEILRRIVGAGGAKVLTALVLVGALTAGSLLGGCLAREVVAERSVLFEVERGPDCVVRVIADGDLVHTTRAAAGSGIRCGLTIDGEARP